MNKGSFLLRQWSSNSPKLSAVAEADVSNAKDEEVSVLGLKWHPEKDTLSIARKIKEQPRSKVNTKRTVTSESASVFDPLGFLGPLHVPAKSFVNQLWQAGKDWDDRLSLAENKQWSKVQVSLSRAHEIKIPRWLVDDATQPLDIIIFCDACPTTAVGCVAYAKQGTRVGLIGSKNKIVSQKNAKQTVPKLELMAMVMGAQYGEILRKTYAKECFTIDITYATDSEIALYWLKSEKKLTPFVMNRVNFIREKSDSNKWYHVATKENSADILSRGATYEELQSSTWETGPVWLKQDKCEWPFVDVCDKPKNIRISLAASLEIDNIFQTRDAGNTSTRPDLQAVIDISKFSSYQKLLRVTALVTRARYQRKE
ncbi:uncharacterized protein LOC135489978 [Lineus longissimus]|uniref:uncharacterized protein LOC135489978 n=1 Tax=Lineus longissimus TaxID=88925 RepID=UPI00315DA21C